MSFGPGELFSLLSAIAWAIGVILYRKLGATMAPLPLNFLKNLLVLGMVLPTLPLLHGFELPQVPSTDIALALLSGMIGIAIADTLYFRALNELGAGRMGIIGNVYSPFVILLSFAFLGERLGPWQLAGFVLVSLGVWLIARPPREWRTQPRHTLRGVLTGLLAVLLMATAIVMIKRTLEDHPLLWITLLRLLGAIGGMLAIAALRGRVRELLPAAGTVRWPLLVLAAFAGQYAAMLLWLAGYKYTDASVAAILNETSSAFIVVLAWLWLGEHMNRRHAAGVIVTLAGVACMTIG